MSDQQDDPNQRILAIINGVRATQTPEELVEFVIHLYGEEFIKANDEIVQLRRSAKVDAYAIELLRATIVEQKRVNDELFTQKQKVVIANRDLIKKIVKKDESLRACKTMFVRKATAPECNVPMADPDSLVAQQINDALR